MNSPTCGTNAGVNAVDVVQVPESSNQTTASGRLPARGAAARALSENAIAWLAGLSWARNSSASVDVRSRARLSAPFTGLPYPRLVTDESAVQVTFAPVSRSHQEFRMNPWVAGTEPVATDACPAQVTVFAYG